MKKSHITVAVLFASLGLTATAFAQSGPGGPGNQDRPQERPGSPAMQGHNGGGYQNQSQNHGPQGGPGAQDHNNGRPPVPMHADNGRDAPVLAVRVQKARVIGTAGTACRATIVIANMWSTIIAVMDCVSPRAVTTGWA